MAQLNLNSFTPSTTIESSKVNSNFTDIQTLVNALRPTLYFYVDGSLATDTNITGEFEIQHSLTINAIDLRCKTAPSGAAVIIDILKNGTTIFSTKPQINDGATTGGNGAVFSTTTLSAGDVLTVNIDQVGSTTTGKDLTIALVNQL